jgi:hypothetical protein
MMPTTKDVTTRDIEMGSGVGLAVVAGFGIHATRFSACQGWGWSSVRAIGLSLGAGVGLALGSTPEPGTGTEDKAE